MPLTEKEFSPSTGVGYWIWAFQIAGVGSLMTSINFLVTILKMRAPGMTPMRMPIFVWTTLFTNILMVLAYPVLTLLFTLLIMTLFVGGTIWIMYNLNYRMM